MQLVARLVVVLALTVPAGCTSSKTNVRVLDEMFGPASIRIHPTFTQFKDWTGDGTPDGVEALVEVQDSFGEPTRAAGSLLFELAEYRQQHPEQRGRRVAGPWRLDVKTMGEQEERWNRAVRAYTFQLEMPIPQERKEYVLSASLELETPGQDRSRLFDELVLERKRAR